MPKTKTPSKRQSKESKETLPYKKTSKRCSWSSSTSKSIAKGKSSANLTWFLKVYKGMDDWHIPIFRDTEQYTKAKHVLYPGSDKHVTASLCFPSVVYVDINKKVEAVFNDDNVLEWVKENKLYSDEAKIKFLCKNFDSNFEKLASFDLMISASAGIVSEPCSKYLRPGGFFLVSDAHFDARTTYLRRDFELVGVFEKDTGKLLTNAADLAGHFHTIKDTPLTSSQVKESIQKPKSRRSFKLKKETWFYLFKKLK